jgi:succinoglycan biosynthesis protein ExoU
MIVKACSRTVDVLIAAWNRSQTIERAVLTALAQDEVRNVIVVDDGSTDDTADKAIRCDPEGKRVMVRRLHSNLGPSAARNVAIELSTAPWFAILDGDDYFLAGRIGTLLSQSEEWDLIADDMLQAPEDGCQPDGASLLGGVCFTPQPLTLEQFVLRNVSKRGALRKELGFLKPLMRRSFLDRHQLRYDEVLRLGEDYALYARALAAGARFLLLPAAGYVSVARSNSLSSQHSGRDLELLRDSDDELMALTTLTARERRAVVKHYSSIDSRVQWLLAIEAFKARNCAQFMSTFCRSPTVTLFIAMRLLEEASSRLRRGMAGVLRPRLTAS